MPSLSTLTIPVTNKSTGEIIRETYDLRDSSFSCDIIAPTENEANYSKNYEANTQFIRNLKLYKTTMDVTAGTPIIVNTNCKQVSDITTQIRNIRNAFDQVGIPTSGVTVAIEPGVALLTATSHSSAEGHQFVAIVANIGNGSYSPMTVLNRGNSSYFTDITYEDCNFSIKGTYGGVLTILYLYKQF